ncbi:MAG TPA: hypothetical protein VJ204_08365 [Solirubrobacterales bacterium]|nr:hypothetical protein [Solirubrobacterales bacterium]
MTPRRIVLAVWDFVVGDDWRLALAAVVAIGLTAVVCALGPSAWWLAPLIALAALRWSLRGAVPAAGPSPGGRNDPTPKAGGPAVDQSGVQSSPK